MTSRWPMEALGIVAPKNDAPMPPASAEVWNLSLEDIEPHTGIVFTKRRMLVSALGSSKCAFDQSHVLYSKLRPYLNKVVVPDEPGVGTSELIPMCPVPARIDRDFLAWYLRSPQFLEFAAGCTRGANLPRIAMSELWDHRVPVPPLEEQKRVVGRILECVVRIAEMRTLRAEADREALALLPSSLAAVFNDLLGKHETVQIGDVLADAKYGTSKKCDGNADGTPVLRIPNVAGGRINIDDLKYCHLERDERLRMALQQADILIVRTNGSPEFVGRCAVYDLAPDVEMAYASYLIRLRVDAKKSDPRYLAFFLMSTLGRDAIAAIRRTSAGQYNINSENLRGIKLPLPPLLKQQEIAERLVEQQDIASRVASEQAAMSHGCEGLQPAVLRRAFAGNL